ncbi:FA9 factor, partial [Acromyrmex insinuator]
MAREARIVGGQDATPREFPWMVSITRKGGHFCGGTILNDKFILTAGHCLCSGTNKIPIGQLRVTLGEHNLRAPEVPAARHESVINAVLHPGHKCGKYVDDIALLEFARPISWSESVKPACLPVATGKPGYSAFSGVEAIVAGWGWLGEDRSKYKRADVLQKVEVRVVTNAVCDEWYASQGKSFSVETKQMCAGWEEGGKDSCWALPHRCSLGAACQSPDHGIHGSLDGHDANFNKYPRYRGNAYTMLFRHDSRPCWMILVSGNWIVYNCIGLALRISNVGWYLCEIVTGADSGGPLMVGSYPAEPLMVIGVVSTGIGCSRSRLPGIYVRVSDYVPWITQEVQSRR